MDINLTDLIERYGSEDRCRAYLEELRWPDGPECPRCAEPTTISKIVARNQYECDSCRYQFSVTAGTLFHDSHLPLWKWFLAIYLICESKKGISANQLKGMLSVSYKTAWYMSHRIREAMGDDDQPLLRGVIEADETYLGGKAHRFKDRQDAARHRMDNKAIVLGAVERGGEVRMRYVRDTKRGTIRQFADEMIADDAEAIYTDYGHSYRHPGEKGTVHAAVNHKAEEWVNGQIHTQTIESVWSLLDRSIIGAFHKISKKHLALYLNEAQFRFNGRENPFLFRDTLLVMLHGDALPYRVLIEPVGANEKAA
jgi:transposase-like protein